MQVSFYAGPLPTFTEHERGEGFGKERQRWTRSMVEALRDPGPPISFGGYIKELAGAKRAW
jgi:hypothetical protein